MHGPAKEQLAIKIDGVLLQAIEKSEDLNQLFNLAEHYGKFHWLNTTSRWACPEVERHSYKGSDNPCTVRRVRRRWSYPPVC